VGYRIPRIVSYLVPCLYTKPLERRHRPLAPFSLPRNNKGPILDVLTRHARPLLASTWCAIPILFRRFPNPIQGKQTSDLISFSLLIPFRWMSPPSPSPWAIKRPSNCFARPLFAAPVRSRQLYQLYLPFPPRLVRSRDLPRDATVLHGSLANLHHYATSTARAQANGSSSRSHDPMQISQICWPVPRILILVRPGFFIWLCVPGPMHHHTRLASLNTARLSPSPT
jgi:hypothetical protein